MISTLRGMLKLVSFILKERGEIIGSPNVEYASNLDQGLVQVFF